jgi:hypothetical protein
VGAGVVERVGAQAVEAARLRLHVAVARIDALARLGYGAPLARLPALAGKDLA